MSLRLKINLIVSSLTLLFVVGLLTLQVGNLRNSVKEEVVAANRVASQLLDRLSRVYMVDGTPAMLSFLRGVGRIRSTEITLTDAKGRVLYESPPSSYKAGRDAPKWFDTLMAPPEADNTHNFPDGRLRVRSNASRAVLDAWDDLAVFSALALGLLVAVNCLVFWLVGRAVRPFGKIVDALGQLQGGAFDVALPPLAGREAAAIGAAFNRMVAMLRDHLETQRRALLAEGKLADSRELSRWIDHHLEQERLMIARELHDELGQSVTAIRSVALSMANRLQARDPESAAAATLIAEESSRLYDAMHGLIPRLTPLVLDSFGLGDALSDLAHRTHQAHPEVQLDLHYERPAQPLEPDAALALYRAAQEGITNALRHGGATRLRLDVRPEGGELVLALVDNGRGLPPGWQPGGAPHGLRWLAERVEGQRGRFSVENLPEGGVRLQVVLPQAPPVQETENAP